MNRSAAPQRRLSGSQFARLKVLLFWPDSGHTADHVEPWRYSARLGETLIEGGPFKRLNYKVP
jgi:hypothetical protein